ncbi:unnamed protein product [Closterium sp. Yama58-4]|nr:unnamed protein product [Closterium sp. Yama58-4]
MIGQGLLGTSYHLDHLLTAVDPVDLPADQLAFQDFLSWADRPATIEAVTRARDNGVVGALTPPFRLNLSLSTTNRPISRGLFIVFPVYRTPDPLPEGLPSSEYRAACLGYMTAVMDFEPMWDAMLAVSGGEGCWGVLGGWGVLRRWEMGGADCSAGACLGYMRANLRSWTLNPCGM